MKSKINLIGTFGLIIGLILVGLIYNVITPQTPKKSDCVTIYIDFGKLNGSKPLTKCLSESKVISGPAFLRDAGYNIVGTQKYPTQIICKLNGLPENDPCVTMPPADAYWAVLLENNNEWTWAQTGIDQVKLKNGQGIGLVYANNGKVKFPN
jgi:hypothetical protein